MTSQSGPRSGATLAEGTGAPSLPVRLALASALAPLAAGQYSSKLAQFVSSEVAEVLGEFGVPGNPQISIELAAGSSSATAVRLWVHDVPQPLSARLIQRCWEVDEPHAGVRTLAEFIDSMRRDGRSSDAAWRRVCRFIARVSGAAIRARPTCMLGTPQVEAYLASDGRAADGLGTSGARLLSEVLHGLLDLGVSVGDRAQIVSQLMNGQAASRRGNDIVESLFIDARAASVEVRAAPAYLDVLVPGWEAAPNSVAVLPGDGRQLLKLLCDGLEHQIGLNSLHVVFRSEPGLPQNSVAVKINAAVVGPFPGLHRHELLVNASLNELAHWKIAGRPDSSSADVVCSIIAERDAARLPVSIARWTPLGSVLMILGDVIQRHAHRCLSLEDLEYRLSQLGTERPLLVRTLLERVEPGEAVRMLRALLREGVSTRDLHSILERLVLFDTLRFDESEDIVFDDRLRVPTRIPDIEVGRWPWLAEFVRGGLRNVISHKYAPSVTSVPVYLMDRALEAEVVAIAQRAFPDGDPASDAQAERIRSAVREALARSPAGERSTPVLTARTVRATLRAILAPEFPDLAVLAYSELRPDLNIAPVERVS